MPILASSSALTAERFRASYYRPVSPPERLAGPPRERWAWFRIGVLAVCRARPRTREALLRQLDVPEGRNPRRIALSTLRRMVAHGLLARTALGYRATERGTAALDGMIGIGMAEGGW